jgi:phage tail sheath protein FI
MATTLLSPGVYVDYVPPSAQPIAGVGTSTAGFVGINSNAAVQALGAVLVTSWTQFVTTFGDLNAAAGATGALVQDDRVLAHAVYGFFNNGGTRCYVVGISKADKVSSALLQLAPIDEIAIVAAPLPLSGDAAAQQTTLKTVADALATHCTSLKDRFAILDSAVDIKQDQLTLDNIGRPQDIQDGYGAFYFPWLQVADPNNPDQAKKKPFVPPSGHVAGVYSRTDAQRGVFKAPANEILSGVLGLRYAVTQNDQDGLNPSGVNCIRLFSGTPYVWGARTLAAKSSEYEQVNVRRFMIFLRESLLAGTRFAVFEPNAPGLWQRITRSVSDFLYTQWRAGALFGETAREAFYVKCDRDTNPDTAPKNQVVTEVGVAVVRAAEFVVFHVQQTRT